MAHKFIVAIDGSDHGWKALDLACLIGGPVDAEVVVLHVVPYEVMPKGLERFAAIEGIPADEMNVRFHTTRAMADKITAEARKRAEENGVGTVTEEVREGHPAREITSVAEAKGADMIFIGSRGLSDVAGLVLGSVSHKVANEAPCTCVIVK